MLRVKIQQAIYDAASAGTYLLASYSAKTGRPDEPAITDTASPKTIRVNEVNSKFGEDKNYRRGIKFVRASWVFSLNLSFDREIHLEQFEQELLDNPLFIGNDEQETSGRRFLISLVDATYTQPPQHNASNGTHVEYTLEAVQVGR